MLNIIKYFCYVFLKFHHLKTFQYECIDEVKERQQKKITKIPLFPVFLYKIHLITFLYSDDSTVGVSVLKILTFQITNCTIISYVGSLVWCAASISFTVILINFCTQFVSLFELEYN